MTPPTTPLAPGTRLFALGVAGDHETISFHFRGGPPLTLWWDGAVQAAWGSDAPVVPAQCFGPCENVLSEVVIDRQGVTFLWPRRQARYHHTADGFAEDKTWGAQ